MRPPPDPGGFHRVQQQGFFFVLHADRGYHPALENVGATDSDKRGSPGMCLLQQVGAEKNRAMGLTRPSCPR
jgi:hypothetical protein